MSPPNEVWQVYIQISNIRRWINHHFGWQQCFAIYEKHTYISLMKWKNHCLTSPSFLLISFLPLVMSPSNEVWQVYIQISKHSRMNQSSFWMTTMFCNIWKAYIHLSLCNEMEDSSITRMRYSNSHGNEIFSCHKPWLSIMSIIGSFLKEWKWNIVT
jgi:hypothetical protein